MLYVYVPSVLQGDILMLINSTLYEYFRRPWLFGDSYYDVVHDIEFHLQKAFQSPRYKSMLLVFIDERYRRRVVFLLNLLWYRCG